MREFQSLEAFIVYLEGLYEKILAAVGPGLEAAAISLQHTAKDSLGTYQTGVAEFPNWPPLTEATMGERDYHGYSPDDPLLVTGELRKHIEYAVSAAQGMAAVGVPSVEVGDHDDPKGDPFTRFRDIGEVALYQELTRSFLGLSAAKTHDRLVHLMALPVVMALAGYEVPQIISPDADDIPF